MVVSEKASLPTLRAVNVNDSEPLFFEEKKAETTPRLPQMIMHDGEKLLAKKRKAGNKSEGFLFIVELTFGLSVRIAPSLPNNSPKYLAERQFMLICTTLR